MSTIKFLGTASEIAEQVRELMRLHVSTEPIRIAVAFWGHGAAEIVGQNANRYQIICNLKSGGTNPEVVRSIKAQPNVSILQLDTLHAKVLISDGGALVSSANLSTNGLALEGVNSQTWKEAGIALPASTIERSEMIEWFERLWDQARRIDECDLEAADHAWARRQAMLQSTNQNSPEVGGTESKGLTLLRTVAFSGRAPMKQVYLRSAAAIVALDGCTGNAMPSSPFKFLFCGGTSRAFNHHESKFEEENGRLKLQKNFVGYFIGSDGLIGTASSPGRLKSFSDATVHAAARWMLGEGTRPDQLEGDILEASFLLK
ncbi:phospholipase D family protein [Pseudomonas sp. RL_5y_Pfl2_73]|uniref:phospholipase D family protein n=1 Tax=Pseudomonas sp. RL_5y_Pfl2_73 TaxID=3088713 RepID=UPI0030DCE16A